MDLSQYRESDSERQRAEDLVDHIKKIAAGGGKALDIGARDGYFSLLMTGYFDEVTALDLKKPEIQNDKVSCVEGDLSGLSFDDDTFDLVLCAEVLEHIPPSST
ncbi:class I SAM-dependent methyltransferase [Marinobacter salinisoli]|uniref:Class I SAM-dependent methyltransferase n=1 Tax=Marinobacter salinisoli TaxID=2769486 RepID=A0ABX7MTF3_9GAMM|nr:class I SAM-dependent methyltransferase [Marinobacter salinisoli]QSP93528.1 class I SAM-dependent methyltransferase [Marinobacter salinisoli]